MKYRGGFVSNSSTASFVLLGFDASDIIDDHWSDEWDTRLCEMECDIITEGEGGAPDGVGIVIGEYISYIHSDGGHSSRGVIDIDKLTKKVQGYKEQLGATTEIKIWEGIMMA